MEFEPQGKCEILRQAPANNDELSMIIKDEKGNIFAINEEQVCEYVPTNLFLVDRTSRVGGPFFSYENIYGNGLFVAIKENNIDLVKRIFQRMNIFEQIEFLKSNEFYIELTKNNSGTFKKQNSFEEYFAEEEPIHKINIEKNSAYDLVQSMLDYFKTPEILSSDEPTDGENK